jgi:hypothetical protein
MIHMTKNATRSIDSRRKLQFKHISPQTLPEKSMLGSPSNMVRPTHLQPLIAACIGDIVPPSVTQFFSAVGSRIKTSSWDISAFRSAPTYGDFGLQN